MVFPIFPTFIGTVDGAALFIDQEAAFSVSSARLWRSGGEEEGVVALEVAFG